MKRCTLFMAGMEKPKRKEDFIFYKEKNIEQKSFKEVFEGNGKFFCP